MPMSAESVSLMAEQLFFDPGLTPADRVVLANLQKDISEVRRRSNGNDSVPESVDEKEARQGEHSPDKSVLGELSSDDCADIARLKAARDPTSSEFQPTIIVSADAVPPDLSKYLNRLILEPYVRLARKVVRHETDVVFATHLLLYFSTSVPSAIYLYRHFTYLHGFLHLVMTGYYIGTYTLMMHQHIHQRGILAKQFGFFDKVFPLITDPLMGHTWNSYYYHHVKHHHVEGNGPDDLSSTIRYQRDSVWHFLHYVGRFYFFAWLELPLYFIRKNRLSIAVQGAAWESGTFLFYYLLSVYINPKATLFVYILPMMCLRFGLMVGNWGQHAFVDDAEPDSDFRSSITLIDVASNRFCFNDGYHTSHHLNPLRHWREHPISLLEQKHIYANESALIFHNIDFIMITVRLLMKDYKTLAKCLVPIGAQVHLSMEGRMELLERLTRKFSEDDIAQKFKTHHSN